MAELLGYQFDRVFSSPIETDRQVATIADRNDIVSSVRWEGMLCYVVSENITYELAGGLLNSNWRPIGGSSLIEAPIDGDVYARKDGGWVKISPPTVVEINGNLFGWIKHPSNFNASVLEVNDMVVNGFWSTTVFWKQAKYIGGDVDLIGSYDVIDSIEEYI